MSGGRGEQRMGGKSGGAEGRKIVTHAENSRNSRQHERKEA